MSDSDLIDRATNSIAQVFADVIRPEVTVAQVLPVGGYRQLAEAALRGAGVIR